MNNSYLLLIFIITGAAFFINVAILLFFLKKRLTVEVNLNLDEIKHYIRCYCKDIQEDLIMIKKTLSKNVTYQIDRFPETSVVPKKKKRKKS